jgi:hypothetical protein
LPFLTNKLWKNSICKIASDLEFEFKARLYEEKLINENNEQSHSYNKYPKDLIEQPILQEKNEEILKLKKQIDELEIIKQASNKTEKNKSKKVNIKNTQSLFNSIDEQKKNSNFNDDQNITDKD